MRKEEHKKKEEEKNGAIPYVSRFPHTQKVTQEKTPCILSVQEQFPSKSLKVQTKKKDIDLQYIY